MAFEQWLPEKWDTSVAIPLPFYVSRQGTVVWTSEEDGTQVFKMVNIEGLQNGKYSHC